MSPEYFPQRPIWLVFDLANGHAPSHRYVWWFDTKKDALNHITHTRTTYPDAAPLSKPVRFLPVSKKPRKSKPKYNFSWEEIGSPNDLC